MAIVKLYGPRELFGTRKGSSWSWTTYAETGKLVAPHEPKVRADLHQAGITDQQIEYVREGMRRVVADGVLRPDGERRVVGDKIVAGSRFMPQRRRLRLGNTHGKVLGK